MRRRRPGPDRSDDCAPRTPYLAGYNEKHERVLRKEMHTMRYEIAVLLKALEDYHHRTGSYYPVDDASLASAIGEARAAYERGLDIEHEETLVEISYVKKIIALSTALTYSDRGIATALSALRFREQQGDDRDPQRPAFHIMWLDERYKLLNLYGQLLDEEKDAMFQLALDALRARGVLPPL